MARTWFTKTFSGDGKPKHEKPKPLEGERVEVPGPFVLTHAAIDAHRGSIYLKGGAFWVSERRWSGRFFVPADGTIIIDCDAAWRATLSGFLVDEGGRELE